MFSWRAPLVGVVALALVVAPFAQSHAKKPKASASRGPCTMVYAGKSFLYPDVIEPRREALVKILTQAGYQAAFWDPDQSKKARPPGTAATECYESTFCLKRMKKAAGSEVLVVYGIVKTTKGYRGRIRMWHPKVSTKTLTFTDATPEGIGRKLGFAMRRTVGSFRREWEKLAPPEASPPLAKVSEPRAKPDWPRAKPERARPAKAKRKAKPKLRKAKAKKLEAKPDPKSIASPKPSLAGDPNSEGKAADPSRHEKTEAMLAKVESESSAEAQPGSDVDVEEILTGENTAMRGESPQASTGVSNEPTQVGLQLGVVGAYQPIRHARTYLVVEEEVGRAPMGAPAVGLDIQYRIPGLSGLYFTIQATYLFDRPLTVVSAAPGFEYQYELGPWAPGLGAHYVYALVGLPVVDAENEELRTTALAHNHGVEGYAAFSFEPAPGLNVDLHLGYRYYFTIVNQFWSGDSVYYARNLRGEVWSVDLSGPMATLSVSYAVWD